MVKIKFCGMTNLDDCQKAEELSVDFIGFVFHKKSKRYVSPDAVKTIVRRLNGKARTVGVFVDEDEGEVKRAVEECGLDLAQVYRPMRMTNRIRVYRIKDALPEEPEPGLILFDTFSDGYGGSGLSFDFDLLDRCQVLDRVFVAGGINEQNVHRVLARRPFGVDLASSVEASPGKKDHGKMERFVKAIRSCDL
jgi:phosphoribosylanthranilate isomerase